MNKITIKNAYENNLKGISLAIPHNKFVVITGVSGSGKSSLAFDIIFQEGQRHYLESLSTKSRQILGKLQRPKVEEIQGIRPAIAINQYTSQPGQRSTLGTLTGIYDLLRLLFARCGEAPQHSNIKINRSLFSFNTAKGACPECNGLGVIDRVNPELLIADESLSIREGAFEMTTPNGYIVYSQVTQDVLNSICKVHGFNIDIPWKSLTSEEKKIVLYGSDKLKVPFGKHTLESRLKWSGITAKPREEGYYKGIIPVMEEILRRDRNTNILRFTQTHPCPVCNGNRLNKDAISILFHGHNIIDYSRLSIAELQQELNTIDSTDQVFISIRNKIIPLLNNLNRLGLDYQTLHTGSDELSMGEIQRARLASLPSLGLQNMIFVLDEPSAGLHMQNIDQLISIIKEIRDLGNSLIIVEHDLQIIKSSDWLIDLGPKAGNSGGELLYNGNLSNFITSTYPLSQTWNFLKHPINLINKTTPQTTNRDIIILGADEKNLNNIDLMLSANAINVVTGVSGSGYRILVQKILAASFSALHGNRRIIPGKVNQIKGLEKYKKMIWVDQKPIGRTNRSNPATYTKVFDRIRSLFASLDSAKKHGYKSGHFSFNNKAGRCETCTGTGQIQIGMHFMEDAYILCEQCKGKRYKNNILNITYHDKNIADILEMSVEEAIGFFNDQPKIIDILTIMNNLGIGYLKLGQSSTTLSGGEAQRIKLASELSGKKGDNNLYILNHPSAGLHPADNTLLIKALKNIAEKGNIVIITEQDPQLILAANRIIEFGPGSGKNGGNVIFSGTPYEILQSKTSQVAPYLLKFKENLFVESLNTKRIQLRSQDSISLKKVKTNNLKGFDLTIPHNKLSVITGISGSGKSSLLYDTIYSESNRRFTSSLSAFARTFLEQSPEPEVEEISGLTPAVAISQNRSVANPRSTVGTFTAVYDNLRLLYSRIAQMEDHNLTTSAFSFNHQDGACRNCRGLGIITVCNSTSLIQDTSKPLMTGALIKDKILAFYIDPQGQHMAILKAVATQMNIDLNKPWSELTPEFKTLIFEGSGNIQYDVTWNYKRGNREGSHEWLTTWPGLSHLIEEEYQRKHADHRAKNFLPLMKDIDCPLCHGKRLQSESLNIFFNDLDISQLANLEIGKLEKLFLSTTYTGYENPILRKLVDSLKPAIIRKLRSIIELDLGYLSLKRNLSTLSGGELQRLRLANQFDTGISGITYILDEPSRGLHPHNRHRIFKHLRKLQANDNTVIIIEHDLDFIKASDCVIELGPKAGDKGGELIFKGTPSHLMESNNTETGFYLNSKKKKEPAYSRLDKSAFRVCGAEYNNLKKLDFSIFPQKINIITGISGSGKSTLLFQVLLPSLQQKKPVNCRRIDFPHAFERIISVKTGEIKSNQLSSVATYSGLMEDIKKTMSNLEICKKNKVSRAMFSYLNKHGQCPLCKGRGQNKISMDFISDITIPCPLCKGRRYNEEILRYTYQGNSIADIMDMTLNQAREISHDKKKISSKLDLASKLGLGYVKLGQATATLSGGEKQRLILIKHLITSTQKNTLFVMDEPSRGLHPADCTHLLNLLKELRDQGNTIVMIEHNCQLIEAGENIIDLGPGAGEKGGNIVVEGSLKDICSNPDSLTGKALRSYFA